MAEVNGVEISDAKAFKRSKRSDGQSLKVVADKGYEKGDIVVANDLIGVAVNGAKATEDIVIYVGQAEFETNEVDDTKDYTVGSAVYWDADNSRLTTTKTGNVLVGYVSETTDTGISFILKY